MKIKTQKISSSILHSKGIDLYIKRLDLNHKFISGNKWFKLKYNIKAAKDLKKDTILTFGGTYSNHIVAASCAAKENGLKSIGIIRGDQTYPLNSSLRLAVNYGMKLKFINRSAYKLKENDDFVLALIKEFGDFHLIPEGGTNELGVKGSMEILNSEDSQDYICTPVGTGGTMSGIINSSNISQQILGFKCIKGEGSLYYDIESFINKKNWTLINHYLFGGYAKKNTELIEFIYSFYNEHNIPLDIIYTAKMMYGIFDLVEKDYFKKHSSILAIHTGGLQGNQGMNERFNLNLPVQS